MNIKAFLLLFAIATLFTFAYGGANIKIKSKESSDVVVNTPETGPVCSESDAKQKIKAKADGDDYTIRKKDSSEDPQYAKAKGDNTKVKIKNNSGGTAKVKATGDSDCD